jgi:aspartyl-tRNA(Asn)/glutamyl-tRNA(Gln) amidotransferase subunit A
VGTTPTAKRPGAAASDGGSAPDLGDRVDEALRASRPALVGGAYTDILGDEALAAAAAGGRPGGPLERRTFAVKDMIAVRGHRQGGGSKTREHAPVCPDDAPVVAALRGAGAVLIGLTTLHELAFGVTGINAYTGTPAHPLDAERIPGGSSSGSAVAVATGSADLALGTDTGGSIRIPAALCGVVGYKPPYGAWPVAGVLPLSGTLDHVGVLARSVAAVAAVDSLFSSSARARFTEGSGAQGQPEHRTFGINRAHLSGSEPAVSAAVASALERLGGDHTLVDVELPAADEVLAVTNAIMFFEAAQLYGDAAIDPASGLGDDVRARLETGLGISADDYARARRRARVITSRAQAIVGALDAVLEPTVPICAPTLGDAPDLGFRLVAHTRLANLTGLPALSLPLVVPGLPVGLQITAARSSELLGWAGLIERVLAAP